MTWTQEDEETWKELTERRENNKADIGKLHSINMLKKIIESLESGENFPAEVNIEYLYAAIPFDYCGSRPVIGKIITLRYDGNIE